MDIAQEAHDLGGRARWVGLIVNGKRVFRLAIGTIGEGLAAYPFLHMLEQSKTESILSRSSAPTHHQFRPLAYATSALKERPRKEPARCRSGI